MLFVAARGVWWWWVGTVGGWCSAAVPDPPRLPLTLAVDEVKAGNSLGPLDDDMNVFIEAGAG